jgi:hypothetical protein
MLLRDALCCVVAGVVLTGATGAVATGEPGAPPEPAGQVKPAASVAFKMPADAQVRFRGVASFDAAGTGAGAMMYPAPNAAGLLVAIFTHALITESAKNSQRSQIQDAADKVLDPHRETLATFGHADLLKRSVARLSAASARKFHDTDANPADADWVIESVPVFSMTQDRRALVLENLVAVHARGAADKPLYQNLVKVVSSSKSADALVDYWGAEQGQRLKDESAALFAHSVDLALDETQRAQAPADPAAAEAPHKTFRFSEGDSERIERAQLVGQRCARVVIRNLRGWVLSVPERRAGADSTERAACSDPRDLP